MKDRLPRKLAAILYADVAGYSRLTGEDEDETHRTLRQSLDLISSIIESHGGQVMHYAGDAVLAKFDAVVNTMSSAMAIQNEIGGLNEDVPDERKVQFRIGVNLGDVIEDRGDIYGDGVNVAARLESLADSGGICISDAVRSAIGNKLDLDYEDLGEQSVKNIAEPVRAYRVLFGSMDRDRREPQSAPASGALAALEVLDRLPVPAKPSIAVLPFTNVSGDPEEEYFSDGVTDGIINGLTRFRDLFVMGRSSSFFFRDKAVDITEIGRKLGAQYVVQGTVRKHEDRVRITAELVDAVTGQNLWAERYDRELKDVFAVEDEVTTTIVAALALRVEDAAQKRSESRPLENLAAYDWLLRGNRCLERGGKEDLLEAQRMYERALELDPDSAAAYVGLAKTYLYEHWNHFAEDHLKAMNRSLEFARKAVALDDADSRAHYALGHAYFCEGQHELAEFHVEQAVALNPSEYHNICMKGYLLACTGRHDESTSCLTDSLRRNPFAPNGCLLALGISDYLARRYQGATVALTRLSSDFPRKFSCLAASYAQLGRNDEAHAAAAEFQELMAPELTTLQGSDSERWRDHWFKLFQFMNPEDFGHLLEGLRKAGLPA